MAVSIDPRDTSADAAAAKAKYLAIYRHPGGRAGWHFLTGPKAVVERLAGTVGFAYRCDAAIDQYMHPVGFVVAAANGRISHDLVVTDPPPAELRAALADAALAQTVGPLTSTTSCRALTRRFGSRRPRPANTGSNVPSFAAPGTPR